MILIEYAHIKTHFGFDAHLFFLKLADTLWLECSI